jgi:hypothetical protein
MSSCFAENTMLFTPPLAPPFSLASHTCPTWKHCSTLVAQALVCWIINFKCKEYFRRFFLFPTQNISFREKYYLKFLALKIYIYNLCWSGQGTTTLWKWYFSNTGEKGKRLAIIVHQKKGKNGFILFFSIFFGSRNRWWAS